MCGNTAKYIQWNTHRIHSTCMQWNTSRAHNRMHFNAHVRWMHKDMDTVLYVLYTSEIQRMHAYAHEYIKIHCYTCVKKPPQNGKKNTPHPPGSPALQQKVTFLNESNTPFGLVKVMVPFTMGGELAEVGRQLGRSPRGICGPNFYMPICLVLY